jgi:hypothetical protein
MSTSIDWSELIKDKKGVVTKDNQACGNIIGEDEQDIIIEEGAINTHIYRVPKSTVGGYNGAELTLNIQYNELETYEEKEEGKDKEKKEGSITESIKNKVNSIKEKTTDTAKDVKEKTVDKATDTTDQEESKSEGSRDTGHADNVSYQTTGGETHRQDQRETMPSDMQTSSTQSSTYSDTTQGFGTKNHDNETNRNLDTGKQSDESSTNVESSFTCETCDTKFQSRQELKEHSAAEH